VAAVGPLTTNVPRSEKNTYGLPTVEPIRRALRKEFRRQRIAICDSLGIATKDDQIGIPPGGFDDYFVGQAGEMADLMTPLLTSLWDESGRRFLAGIGLDANQWEVVNPETARMIETAALEFCQATNETTSMQLDAALSKLKEELHAGIVATGESVIELTKRVNAVFDTAEKWRARRIATTEASRAVHAAQIEAGRQSGVVTGWRWLLSGDACPVCVEIAEKVNAVRLGGSFATIGEHPTYSDIRHPPAHPHCMCALTPVLDIDEQPQFNPPVVDPTGAEYEAVEA
jgi:hypothetical protein